MINPISDALARQEALNPLYSYIVQAPAGSGKTELLTQRFLKLLASVETPESIIALTFTQKAAAEMRERILSSIEKVANNEKNSQPETDRLAAEVLAHDKKKNWQLLQSPHRVRIQTIDSLCFELVSKMPILSQGIPYASIVEDSNVYYQEAAERCINEGMQDPVYQAAVETLLLHTGNHYARCLALLSDMLSWREQWLMPVIYTQSFSPLKRKQILEGALINLREEAEAHLEKLFSEEIKKELNFLCDYAAENSSAQSLEAENFWSKVSVLLLTKENTWRSRVDKKIGFPSPSETKNSDEKERFKEMKQRLESLLSYWRESPHESESLRLALENYRCLPPLIYSEEQWIILDALLTLLPLLTAQLKIVFMETGKTDFSEISEQAAIALGKIDEPSDLALYYDYTIQHLLIDEFQDTSLKHFTLLEKLTQGWQPDDGRTLFIVGDPMQSIYRFREADVSLFLKVRDSGLGAVVLRSLTLTSNFRSCPQLISWINQCFSSIFPSQDNHYLGAVKHHASSPGRSVYSNEGNIQFYAHETAEQQGEKIAAIISQIPSHESVAILVRSRGQLKSILPYLQKARIGFQSVDIDPLAIRPYIQDLYSLTQTLLQPANLLAWYAILRSPWCGLTLADLWALSQNKEMSEDGKKRYNHVKSIIDNARQQRQRKSLSLWIESTWRALGGHLLVDTGAQKDIEVFLELLDGYTYEQVNLAQELKEKVDKLFSNISQESHVHVMTIHKSKGLEFDHVILPHLESSSSRQDTPLLQHMEYRTSQGKNDLLLAVMKSVETSQEPLYQYLQYTQEKKDNFERQRLLYVALTRARSDLHLFSAASATKNSFLQELMPFLPESISTSSQQENISKKIIIPSLRRFTSVYFDSEKKFPLSPLCKGGNPPTVYLESSPLHKGGRRGDFPSIIGTFIHEQIHYCAENYFQYPPELERQTGKHRLIELGLYEQEDQEKVLNLAQKAIDNLYSDPRGQWILSANHQESKNEYAVYYVDPVDNITRRTAVLDRTFLDTQENIRWIIDYKTTQDDNLPSGTVSIDFAPPHYCAQLEHYGQLLRQLLSNESDIPIYLGLYYPLTQTWISWPMQ